MQFAKINDANLHYQVIGAPEGKPTIIFVNPLGTDFRIWRDVIMRMVGEFAIVTYDKRGHGLSDVGQTPYSINDHVEDLKGLMLHLGVTEAIICGTSVGGLIAQGLYHAYPEMVQSLVLCGTAEKIGTNELWNMRIETLEDKGISGIADQILTNWFTEEFRKTDNAEFIGYRNMLTRMPIEGYISTCKAIRDADFSEQTDRIKVPTICIVGKDDGSTPPDIVRETAKKIPNAYFEQIPNCGHIPSIETPELLSEIIKAFLENIKKAA